MTAKNPLPFVVHRPSTGQQPPAGLGTAGSTLWRDVLRDYAIDDAPALEVLRQACEALDRAKALKTAIGDMGLTVATPTGGAKVNPLLAAEATNRSLLVRFLSRLGVLEQQKRDHPGRPPGAAA